MAKEIGNPASSLFEQIKKVDKKGIEYWTSRDLSKVLEYSEYRHFLPAVTKAKEACKKVVIYLMTISRISSKWSK